MFGGSDFLGDISFPTQEPGNSQEEISGPTRFAEDSLTPGIVPLTVALCLNKWKATGAFVDGRVTVYDQEYQFCEIVGWISSVDIPAQDTWELSFDDGTGTMPVVYQLKTDLGAQFESDLNQIRPDNTENQNVKKPCRIIGIPQVLDSRLYLQAICIKPCSADELYVSHPFNVVQHYLRHSDNNSKSRSKSIDRQSGVDPVNANVAVDPFEGEEIVIEDADVSDIVGDDRLRRVLWKLMSSEMMKGNKSVYRNTLMTRCSKWTHGEVNNALEELEEGGVIIYLSGDKQKIALI